MGVTCYFTDPVPMNKLLLPFLSTLLLGALLMGVGMTGFAGHARAGEPDPALPAVSARLIAGVTGTGTAPDVPLGLDLTLEKGWKTYWRFPGAAGYPASLKPDGATQNLGSLTWHWPAPRRFVFETLQSFGYEERVVIPLTAHLEKPGAALTLSGVLDLMVCKEVCIPQTFPVALKLPAGPADPSPDASLLQRWQKRVPGDGIGSGLSLLGAEVQGTTLDVAVTAHPALESPDLFVETAQGYTLPAPQLERGTPDRLRIPLTPRQAERLAGQEVTLTLTDHGPDHGSVRSVEKKLTLPVAPGAASPAVPKIPATGALPLSWMAALIAAFLGGLILNLMPCVLPVLSLKLLAVVQHANSPPAHVRLSFLASAAGIVTSFLVLAGIAIGFQQAGQTVGWGMQFQHPVFLGGLILVLTLFAASLWDLIHIPLPRFLTDALADRLPEPGHQDTTLVGHFLTGAFTTLLATPCSAPFVGTAIGFALAGGPLALLGVALSMGVGLATPFLLVAAFPQVARLVPRPGAWMGWLRGLFGVALMITALWLARVMGEGRDVRIASALMGAVLLVLFVLWIRASLQRPFLLVKGIAAIAVCIYALQGISALERTYIVGAAHPQINWIAFDPGVIPSLVGEGKVVFVDITAGWCLTCKANKMLVLDREPTLSRLRGADVVTMQADWTRPDPTIPAYLKTFGRYGIPFNVVYGPGAPDGLPLPELLSAAKVATALERARLQNDRK